MRNWPVTESSATAANAKPSIIDAMVLAGGSRLMPTKDEVKAAVSACAARPCCAIGWPSKVVATDHGSPGMLNRIDVMAPPNSAPQ
jgi:hypothetical protein